MNDEERNKVKKLSRTKKNRILGGVLGGIGVYFNVDPTIVRILFVVFLVITGLIPMALLYLVFWILIPDAPKASGHNTVSNEEQETLERSKASLVALVVLLLVLGTFMFFIGSMISVMRGAFT